MNRATRAVLVTACALLAGGLLPAVLPDAAGAAEYRYWSYWQADGQTWRYASVGPGGTRPEDGDVEGWRFLVSAEREGSPPRSPADFDDICRGREPAPGSKRVAVVVDYGTSGDAPEEEQPPNPRTACAVVREDATGADVLAAVAEPRFNDDGLLCAIDSYPLSGCAETVGGSSDTGMREGGGDRNVPGTRPGQGPGGGGPRTGLIVGIALLLALGGAAAWRARSVRHP